MRIYTYAEANQNLAALLEQANSEGRIVIKREDGQSFLLTPIPSSASPLDIEGIDLGLSADEIVSLVRESRERP